MRHLDLAGFSALRVLVAGDFMLDEYLWGRVERISPEAPVVVVEVERETRTLGGAGNVVNNLVALGARVEVLGLVGDDHPGQLLRQEMARLGVDAAGLFADPQRRTSRKTRVLGNSQQVVRIDRETRNPAGPEFPGRGRPIPPGPPARTSRHRPVRLRQGRPHHPAAPGGHPPGAGPGAAGGGGPQGGGLLRLRRGHGDHPQPQRSGAGRG